MVELELDQIFSPAGLLASKLANYKPRKAQIDLAQAVAKAISNQQVLISEAGTGTGKTFAYLIPALLSEQKILISSGTKNLQDQLFRRDIPFIRRLLGFPGKIALLKGRQNYLCIYLIM